jgi:hypothetical protein
MPWLTRMALWVMPRKGRKVFFSEEKKQKTFIFRSYAGGNTRFRHSAG